MVGERWRNPPARPWLGEAARLSILGAGFAIAWLPIWLPLFVDYAGFGGFPHRVGDETGPGLVKLLDWYVSGEPFYTPPGALSDAVVAAVEKETGARPIFSTSGGTFLCTGTLLADIPRQHKVLMGHGDSVVAAAVQRLQQIGHDVLLTSALAQEP